MTRAAVATLGFALIVGAAGTTGQEMALRIVSPVADSYLSDRVTFEARIEPASRRAEVKEVLFFADGVQVCRSTDRHRPLCGWDAGPTIKPHLIRVVAPLESGDRLVASVRTRGVDHAESVDVRAVQVNVGVFDRRGSSIRGLTRDRFRLREDGVLQTITNFGSEDTPLELVLAVDVSGSMGGVMEELKDAVRQFLSRLKPIDRVTLVAFNEEMFVLSRREADPVARARAVDALASWGSTSLYDVIIRSLELVSRQPGRRGLVVFSDGEDRSSQTTLAAVARALQASDATLFSVALGRGRESDALRKTLEQLAEPSGGRVVIAERAEDLRRAFDDVLQDLQHQYLLGFQSTNDKLDGTFRRLSIEVTDGNYRVRARAGYTAVKP
jgi:Ca-activated chloride channel homolog